MNTPGTVACAATSTVATPPFEIEPKFTITTEFVAKIVPCEGIPETKLNCAGSVSNTVTLLATFGPWFCTEIKYVITPPTCTGSTVSIIVTARSFVEAGCVVVMSNSQPPRKNPSAEPPRDFANSDQLPFALSREYTERFVFACGPAGAGDGNVTVPAGSSSDGA